MPLTTRKSTEFSTFRLDSDIQRGIMFDDLYNSAMGKAVRISSSIQGITLGPNATDFSCNETLPSEPFVISLPQLTSTPKRSVKNLSEKVLRRPNKASTFFEIKSSDNVEQKTLLAEIVKTQVIEANKAHTNLEMTVKANEKKVLDKLSQLYITSKCKKQVETNLIQKALIKKEVVAETEEDKIAESQAHERSKRVQQNLEEAKKKSAAIQEKRKLYEIMASWQVNYTSEYRKVLDILQSCKDPRALQEIISPHFRKLQEDATLTEDLRMKVRRDELTPDDLKIADMVMKNLYNVLAAITSEAKNIDSAVSERIRETARQKDEDEKKIVEAANEKKLAEESQKTLASETSTLSDCFDPESIQNFIRLREHLSEVNKTLETLLKDPAMNKFRFELQKAVTLPVNAISPVSAEHMMDKYRKLHNLLSGRRADDGSSAVAASDHQLGGLFIKNTLAKLFVRQGEMTVSSKPEAAFALASILVNLWIEFPDFGELVLSHFYKQCPYLAPVFLPQVEGQSDQDYYRSLGYLTNNGEIEKQDMFLKRMKGIMRLYAAVLITKPRNSSKPNPLGLKEAWRWLAAILNLEPRPDICAVLILELLEVVGNDLLLVYRGQAKKLLAHICKEYFPRLDKVTASTTRGPLTRLETFLEKAAKEGTIRPPAQRLSHNFW